MPWTLIPKALITGGKFIVKGLMEAGPKLLKLGKKLTSKTGKAINKAGELLTKQKGSDVLGNTPKFTDIAKKQIKNTLNKSYLIRIMAFINVYFTFGDFEYDSYKKLYGKMTEESYNRELSKIKDYFASEIEDLHPQRSLYYIFGCVYGYYMYDKLKSDKAYINNIYQAFSIPYRTNLQSFSIALGIYKIESDLKEAITSYKTELNNETKTL